MAKRADQCRLRIVPLTLNQANDLILTLHRHHGRVVGHRFSLGVRDETGQLRGAVVIGRPVCREVDQYLVAEVTRLVTDGCPNACSALYGAAARAAGAMGFDSIQTYILGSEPGTSLRAAGWHPVGVVVGRSWSVPSRPRVDKHPVEGKAKWAKMLNVQRG